MRPDLERWREAGLISAETVAAIESFEAARTPAHKRLSLPVLLVVIGGGVLLAAGILLFIAANWDGLSPIGRLALICALLATLHTAGGYFAESIPALSITLHTVATFGVGAGIALIGQTFNLESHWTNAILLWALAAAIAWWILQHWTQAVLLALLLPAWVAGLPDKYGQPIQLAIVFIAMTALFYLAARHDGDGSRLRQGLSWVGGLALLPAMTILAHEYRANRISTPPLLATIAAIALPLAVHCVDRRQLSIPGLIAAAWVTLYTVARPQEVVLACLWGAALATGLAAWGVVEKHQARVNWGVAGFTLSVLGFYFDTFWDKLGRSLALVITGLMLLALAWGMETTRRRLISRIDS